MPRLGLNPNPKHIYCDFEYRDRHAGGTTSVQLILGCFYIAELDTWIDIDFRDPVHGCSALKALYHRYKQDIFLTFGGWEIAEIMCFEAAGIDVRGMHWIDLYTESNQITGSHDAFWLPTDRRGLLAVLEKFGIKTRGSSIHKQQTVELILATDQYSAAEWVIIVDYCHSDIEPLPLLFQRLMQMLRQPRRAAPYTENSALFHGDYLVAQAHLDATSRGFPIDTNLLDRIVSHRKAICNLLADDCNRNFQTQLYRYVPRTDSYSFNERALVELARREDMLVQWQVTPSGMLRKTEDYLEEFCEANPYFKPLADTRRTLNHLKAIDLHPLLRHDAEGNGFIRGVNAPLHAITGRNQPMSTKGMILNLPSWLRCLMRPHPGHVIISGDWSQQEIVIAAALSGDDKLCDAIETGDVYLALAKLAGAVPADATEKTHPLERQLYKSCLAAGTLVVTDHGLLPIEHITSEHLLWDGVEWVRHDGLLDQGQQETLTVSGVSLTADHRVWCGTQWREARYLALGANNPYRQSALSAATLPSPATWSDNAVAYRPFWCDAPSAIDRSTRSIAATFAGCGVHAVRPVRPLQPANPVGGRTVMLWPMTATETACSTECPLPSHAVTHLPMPRMPTTASAVSVSVPNGVRIGAVSSATCRPCPAGTIHSWRWTGSTPTAIISRGISVSSPARKTPVTDDVWQTLKPASASLKHVYDLANAGPRHRYTIMTDDGPLIVSNCQLGLNYGMGKLALALAIYTDLLAKGGKISFDEALATAVGLLVWHKRTFKTFWAWQSQRIEQSRKDKCIYTPDNWTLFVDRWKKATAIGNFPMQAGAACVLREAIKLLAKEDDVELIASHHDAIYLYADESDAPAIKAKLLRCMTQAVDRMMQTAKRAMPIRVDLKVYSHGTGYHDPRGRRTHALVMELMDAIEKKSNESVLVF